MSLDLRAAFDTMDRSVLDRVMREREIREELVGRMEKTLKERRSKVRTREETGKSF